MNTIKVCQSNIAKCTARALQQPVNWGEFSISNEREIDISDANKGYVGTISGRKVFPMNPDPLSIDINDIAHALGLICRWNGHIKEHFSVAQHCVRVSQICKPEDALIGLLHDAAEAYIGDMTRPVKYLPEVYAAYSLMESKLNEAIAKRFGLKTIEKTPSVQWADMVLLAGEAVVLRNGSQWAQESIDKLCPGFELGPIWSAKYSENEFLRRFYTLVGRINAS